MLIFAIKQAIMRINYQFSSDKEPTDEQLHLLMQDVAAEVKEKARKTNEIFFEQLKQLLIRVKNHQRINIPDAK